MVSRAFCGTESTAPEPVNAWAYGGTTVLGPLSAAPAPERAAWFQWACAFGMRACLGVGGVYALVDTASGQVVAATGVFPPGKRNMGGMSMRELMAIFGAMPEGGMGGPNKDRVWVGELPDGTTDRCMAAEKCMSAKHKELMAGDHLAVYLFGSDPAAQGTGAGSALIAFVNQLADAEGVVSYLETAGQGGPGFFAKKGGFEEVQRLPVLYSKGADYDADGGMCCMVRPAKATKEFLAP